MKPRFQQKFIAIMALLAGLAVSTNTWATVLFYSTPFSVTDIITEPVEGSFSGTLSASQLLELPRFDPTLGTLQGVEIEFQSNYEVFILGEARDTRGEFVFFPFGESNDAGIDASVEGSLRVQLFDPSSSTTTLNIPSVNAFCYESISVAEPVLCLAQTSSTANAYNALMPLGALGLLDFVGADPINLFTSLGGTFFGTCDGDDLADECALQVRINWFGLVGVTYTYGIDGGGDPPGGGGGGNTVPEPDSNLLIAIGLVLLALLRRRPVAMSGGRLTR
ncbi:MAG: choice-of-anchor E domain-containing protein [Thiobacillus sp.]|nr:choice-of-anchor E domain-containing protein [Thiobacillus sp.]